MAKAQYDEYGNRIGDTSPRAKLTPEQVQESVTLYSNLASLQAQANDKGFVGKEKAKAQAYLNDAEIAVRNFNLNRDIAEASTFDSAELNRIIAESEAAIAGANTAISEAEAVTTTAENRIAGKTMAMDTFRNTLAAYFGAAEMAKPWVNALYNVMSKYYNTGSTIAESLNLSLQDARTSPDLKEFKDRFAPIYALQDRLQKGEAVTVPTIAEFVKSESDLGDVLREAGLGDLATQKFLGTVLTDKSVLTATNIITDIFDRIDNAPSALKSDLTSLMNLGASRTDIAKALLTGEEGAAALQKKINNLTVFSAAKTQGVNIDMTTAEDIASAGSDYSGSLTGFGKVKNLERADTLARFGGGTFTQGEAIGATFQQNIAAINKAEAEQAKESARFGGTSGLAASALRGRSGRQQI